MTWHLTIVRHGEASPARTPGGDASRVLTSRGRSDVRRVAERWASKHGSATRIWTSPLVRAVQTSELFSGGIGYAGTIEIIDQLEPEARPSELLIALEVNVDETGASVLVGHEPNVRVLTSMLLSGAFSEPFAPGMAVVVALDGPLAPGAARLVEVIRPSSLAPPGRPSEAFRW